MPISTNVLTVLQQLPPEILKYQPWNRPLRPQIDGSLREQMVHFV